MLCITHYVQVMSVDKSEYLPYSGERYWVNEKGEIFSNEGKLETVRNNDGRYHVFLEWVLGARLYEVASVVYLTFNNVGLPIKFWGTLIFYHKDGDLTNDHLENIYYRFKKGPLEVPNRPGFYYIPYFTRYGVNENGVIITIVSGAPKSQRPTKPRKDTNAVCGYLSTRLVADNGKRSCILFTHRALCLVFKHYDSDPFSLVVNHKDGRPDNNGLYNLEWTTYTGNIEHAYETGLRSDSQTPVLSRNVETKEVLEFPSRRACARHHNHLSTTEIWRRIHWYPERLCEDKLLFKLDDGSEWPVITPETPVHEGRKLRNIAARNVFTGKIMVFNNCVEAEKILGVAKNSIYKHALKEMEIPCKGFNFRFFTDNLFWPKHNERLLSIYRDSPDQPSNGVVIKDKVKGEEHFFTHAVKASAFLGISKNALPAKIRSGTSHKGRYELSYYRLLDHIK